MINKRGTLFLVVGPSGAGKDSLIDGAKEALQGDGGHVFPRRYITRPADAGGENHIPVSNEMFATLLDRGEMLLSWQAHNLQYGVPLAIGEHLARGRNVILNVSRTVVDFARETLSPVKVLYITVSDETLTERLHARGRESSADIKRRVARAREYVISGDDVYEINNGGTLDASICEFLSSIDPSSSG